MDLELGRRSLIRTGAVAGGTAVAAGALGAAPAEARPPRPGRAGTGVAVGFVVAPAAVVAERDGDVVEVTMLLGGRRRTVRTQPLGYGAAQEVAAGLVAGSLVDFELRRGRVVVPRESSQTFHTVLTKSATPVFVTQKYGPALAPRKGRPGAMVAAGWVYARRGSSITVGDGRVVTHDMAGRRLPRPEKRYEETYRVAPDVEVYEVDTADWTRSRPSSLRRVPVTKDYSYATTERQAAFVVFDRDFRRAAQARVTQVYYFTPADTSDGKPVWDVPTQSSLLADRGTDPVSGTPYVDIVATGVTRAAYTRSTEPFEIVPDTMFYVGDNEVSLYLFRTAGGRGGRQRLVLVDTGWPNSGYQYWKNIEAMGFDPRDVDDVVMAHGHLDHYGTTVELVTMIEDAGGTVRLHSPREDIVGLGQDAVGNTWDLPPALPASETLIRRRSSFLRYDEWWDLGNVRLKPLWSPGHTPGSASFVFEVRHPRTRRWVSFGYMGGYGWSPKTLTATNGWQRLGFAYNLAWLQQRLDVDFAAPQHANQFPLVDIHQALKAHNNDPAHRRRQLTMLDAMVEGEFVNQMEKRYATATNAVSDDQPGYQSIETYGPFKPGREDGARDVEVRLVDGGLVLHGYDKAMNVNPRIDLLREGVEIRVDSHVHDPDGWYVQLELDVLDSYGGFLPGVGPVESIRPEVTEVLRTQRLGSREEAEAIAASVRAGGTYRIDLTKASAIVVPDDGRAVFRA